MNGIGPEPAWRRWAVRILIGLPLANLTLALVAWLRFGIDLPWYDDWRGYDGGWIQSLQLERLFTPLNYTLSPVGLALDAIVQRTLDGNTIAYQFLSQLLVLGGLLLLQWKLLAHVLRDRLQASACFSLTVLMLQPGTYWGQENLAYHQALPLLFLGWALLLVLREGGAAGWRQPVVALLTALGGLSYISGAFGGLAVGGVLLAAAWLWQRRGATPPVRLCDALWFSAGAAFAAALQFKLAFLGTQGTGSAVPLAMPYEAPFWWFYLGKIARSLLLPHDWPLFSFLVNLVACIAAVALGWVLGRGALRGQGDVREHQGIVLYIALGAMVAVYLALVSVGRAALRPTGADEPLAIFAHAFVRFHYFWATLLWPWFAAAVLLLARRQAWAARRAWQAAGLAALALLAWFFHAQGAYDHMAYQRDRGIDREVTLHCYMQEMQKAAPVRCRGLLPPQPGNPAPDARVAFAHASRIGASFVRQFPPGAHSAWLAGQPKLFDLDGSAGSLETQRLRRAGDAFEVDGSDPQMYLNSNQPALANRCTAIELVAEMRVGERDFAQVYWGEPDFVGPYGERYSDARVLESTGGWETVSMRLRSAAGFYPSLRFDPVSDAQPFGLRSLRVYCVQQPG